MNTAEKKREVIRYLADINAPTAIDGIFRYVYRHFLKSPEAVEPDYFGECLKLLPDVPQKHLPDVYAIICGLSRPQQ